MRCFPDLVLDTPRWQMRYCLLDLPTLTLGFNLLELTTVSPILEEDDQSNVGFTWISKINHVSVYILLYIHIDEGI